MSLAFPSEIIPRYSRATGCSGSYKMSIADSTISVTTDANYKRTRPRTTRMIRSWTFAYNALTDEKYDALVAFFETVGKFQSFTFTNPIDDKDYTVRFTSDFSFQYVAPNGWQGSLTFEEV